MPIADKSMEGVVGETYSKHCKTFKSLPWYDGNKFHLTQKRNFSGRQAWWQW